MQPLSITIAGALTRIFLRDRQAIFFSLFFPIIFMSVFGFVERRGPQTIDIGVVNEAPGPLSEDFMAALTGNDVFRVQSGTEAELRETLIEGDVSLVLVVPPEFQQADSGVQLRVMVDASQVQLLGLIMPVLEQSLLRVERELRGTEPLFTLTLEDVQARSQRYLDFLVPGLIAFTLMQLAIAGSGFNIVEYRRKGILKRLFVTPVQPRDFIAGIVLSRLLLSIMQITVLLAVAVFLLDVQILGSYPAFYVSIIMGSVVFLCLGFFLGSLAKTQQSIQAIGNLVIFPQIFLSGIFYPIDSMPAFIQPVAYVLPLSYVANALRGIANEGLSLLQLLPDLTGILVWMAVSFFLATRFFVWKEVAS